MVSSVYRPECAGEGRQLLGDSRAAGTGVSESRVGDRSTGDCVFTCRCPGSAGVLQSEPVRQSQSQPYLHNHLLLLCYLLLLLLYDDDDDIIILFGKQLQDFSNDLWCFKSGHCSPIVFNCIYHILFIIVVLISLHLSYCVMYLSVSYLYICLRPQRK